MDRKIGEIPSVEGYKTSKIPSLENQKVGVGMLGVIHGEMPDDSTPASPIPQTPAKYYERKPRNAAEH